MTNFAEAAKQIPIITVLSARRAAKERLTLTEDGRDTREIEDAFGFRRSRYFYAGRAHPRFGDVALAYKPEVEAEKTGSATPFDSGAVYRGHCHPFKSGEEGGDAPNLDSRIDLVDETTEDLSEWRDAFEEYLEAFFDEPQSYVRGEEPDWEASWGPDDLPARHRANGEDSSVDWSAWCWEVRLYEEHAVHEGLRLIACSETAADDLERRARSSSSPGITNSAPLLLNRTLLVDEDTSVAFRKLEEDIEDSL